MKKAYYFFIVLFLLSVQSIFSQTSITVLDFDVQSSNPEYQFLGKGFAQFLSVELSQVKALTLIERKKRNQMIEEIKFGLSGMADEESLIELGNMLQSDYMIAGEIFDMAGSLVITARMIDIETGIVKSQFGVEGSSDDFKYITRDLTLSILNALNINPETPLESITKSKDDELVLSSFSTAVDAYDQGDEESAREALSVAEELDKDNKAVNQLSNALNIISPKFQFEDNQWKASYNPSTSALLDESIVYVRTTLMGISNFANTESLKKDENEEPPYHPVIMIGNEITPSYIQFNSHKFSGHVGYSMPMGEQWGLNFEFCVEDAFEDVEVCSDFTGDANPINVPILIDGEQVFEGSKYSGPISMYFSAGTSYQFNKMFAVGLNASMIMPYRSFSEYNDDGIIGSGDSFDYDGHTFGTADDGDVYAAKDEIGFSINPGVVAIFFDNRLYMDFQVNYVHLQRFYYDYKQDAFVTGTYPLYTSLGINGSVIPNTPLVSWNKIRYQYL